MSGIPKTVFGEVLVGASTPVFHSDAVNGLKDTDFTTKSSGTGATASENTGTGFELKANTGTTANSMAEIKSRRYLRYQPGRGASFRFTARFDEGVANSRLMAGALSIGSDLCFGYENGDFGILYSTGGLPEVRTLTIATAAGGAETGTVTLDGTAFGSISLTSGTEAHNAFEIAGESFTNWSAFQNGDTIVFVSTADAGPLDGTFSFSSTGTAAGTFARTITGVAKTDTFIKQGDWNIEPCLGKEKSLGFNLDPTNGNVYQIRYQFLGYGKIEFFLENPETGGFIPVHEIKYANQNTSPSLTIPSMSVGIVARSNGSTQDLAIRTASVAGFVEGIVSPGRNPEGRTNTKTGVGTSFTNILSIRCRTVQNGNVVASFLRGVLATASVDGNKPAQVQIILNATLGGEPNWTYQDETNSIVEYDTAATSVTENANSAVLAEVGAAATGSVEINLKRDMDVVLVRGDVLTIAVAATSATTDATAGFVWQEN